MRNISLVSLFHYEPFKAWNIRTKISERENCIHILLETYDNHIIINTKNIKLTGK